MATRPASLILVPTELERGHLEGLGGLPPELGPWALCGFGPVCAAARAAQLVAQHRPARVLLLGIAGTLGPEAPLGGALAFPRVLLDGIGVGSGPKLLSPSRLGLPQWEGGPGEAVLESLPLSGAGPGALLTVCAASATPSQAMERARRFPEAIAEDMEGFAVALACRLFELPLIVVRGISNPAGVRDPRQWHVREALAAARTSALEWLERESWEAQ